MVDTDSILNDLESWVLDEDKVVSYRWLANTTSTPSSTCIRLLEKFASNNSEVGLLHFLSGKLRETGAHKVLVVKDLELDDKKRVFDIIISLHPYAVYHRKPAARKDTQGEVLGAVVSSSDLSQWKTLQTSESPEGHAFRTNQLSSVQFSSLSLVDKENRTKEVTAAHSSNPFDHHSVAKAGRTDSAPTAKSVPAPKRSSSIEHKKDSLPKNSGRPLADSSNRQGKPQNSSLAQMFKRQASQAEKERESPRKTTISRAAGTIESQQASSRQTTTQAKDVNPPAALEEKFVEPVTGKADDETDEEFEFGETVRKRSKRVRKIEAPSDEEMESDHHQDAQEEPSAPKRQRKSRASKAKAPPPTYNPYFIESPPEPSSAEGEITKKRVLVSRMRMDEKGNFVTEDVYEEREVSPTSPKEPVKAPSPRKKKPEEPVKERNGEASAPGNTTKSGKAPTIPHSKKAPKKTGPGVQKTMMSFFARK